MNMIKSDTITKIAGALLRAQRNMSNAVKDSKNPFFKSSYADLNAVREASHGALNAEGIVVLQPTISNELGQSFVRTLLLHESGEFLGSDTQIVCAKANDPQALGSAITYARRYGLQAMVSLGAEDDDGEKAMGRTRPISTSGYKTTLTTTVATTEAANVTPANSNGTVKVGSFNKNKAKAATPATSTPDGWE